MTRPKRNDEPLQPRQAQRLAAGVAGVVVTPKGPRLAYEMFPGNTADKLRRADSGVRYLVGTPKGRLTRLEAELAGLPWREVHEKLSVKLLAGDGEIYVLTQRTARVEKERGMRRRALKNFGNRPGEIAGACQPPVVDVRGSDRPGASS